MDIYDEAVAYLTEHPSEITTCWFRPSSMWQGCLFGFVAQDRRAEGFDVGCLCMVAHGSWDAETKELTRAIKADKTIPESGDIKPGDLHVFAAWQRKIDTDLSRPTPSKEQYHESL